MTETPERPELLPCPFCGSDKILVNRDSDYEDNWIVQCDNRSDACPMVIQVIDAITRERAVEAWNRRASSLGEPVSQEAPIPFSAMPSYVLHCDAQDVGQLAETRFKSRDRISVMLNEDWRRLCAALSGGIPRTDSAPSVISSASPLSEEERGILAAFRWLDYEGDSDTVEVSRANLRFLVAIADRLSASAPSPEGAPAEPTLVVGFNRETGNPNVGARSVETSDFCATCVRGYCEDRYSIRECRGHWHVTMCGADLAIPGDPFASAEIAQRAADAENRGRDPGGEA